MAHPCDAIIVRNFNIETASRAQLFFMLRGASKEWYESNRRNGGIRALGYGDLDYGEFQSKIQKDMDDMKIRMSSEEALNSVSIELPKENAQEWGKCMARNNKGLSCWVDGTYDETLFTLHLLYEPYSVRQGEIEVLTKNISASGGGTASYAVPIPATFPPGPFGVEITRSANNVAVRGTINARTVGDLKDAFSASFYIPPFPNLRTTYPDYQLSDHPEALIGKGNIHPDITFNRMYWREKDGAAYVGGKHWPKVIGMHPPDNGTAFAEFQIPPGAKVFHSDFGLTNQGDTPIEGHVVGRVLVDGIQEWSDEVTPTKVVTETRRILVEGKQKLRLETDSKGRYNGDHATWGNPTFSDR